MYKRRRKQPTVLCKSVSRLPISVVFSSTRERKAVNNLFEMCFIEMREIAELNTNRVLQLLENSVANIKCDEDKAEIRKCDTILRSTVSQRSA